MRGSPFVAISDAFRPLGASTTGAAALVLGRPVYSPVISSRRIFQGAVDPTARGPFLFFLLRYLVLVRFNCVRVRASLMVGDLAGVLIFLIGEQWQYSGLER